MSLVAIILTYNEDKHIDRCIRSLSSIADAILVVDSGSTDRTQDIARALGARVVQRPFRYHAEQFNWALTQIGAEFDWVLRIDADEYLSPELQQSISEAIAIAKIGTSGFVLKRGICFLGRLIRHGGVFPVPVLRLFRNGEGYSENRWMDEHIVVQGSTAVLDGILIDDNLNTLTWWTDKHNRYASREALEVLNREFNWYSAFGSDIHEAPVHVSARRWFKDSLYSRLPGGLRALAYFLYRYLFRLGFLDGAKGTVFHVLQGFWYRYLVDAKIEEVRMHIQDSGCTPIEAAIRVLGIDPRPTTKEGPRG